MHLGAETAGLFGIDDLVARKHRLGAPNRVLSGPDTAQTERRARKEITRSSRGAELEPCSGRTHVSTALRTVGRDDRGDDTAQADWNVVQPLAQHLTLTPWQHDALCQFQAS